MNYLEESFKEDEIIKVKTKWDDIKQVYFRAKKLKYDDRGSFCDKYSYGNKVYFYYGDISFSEPHKIVGWCSLTPEWGELYYLLQAPDGTYTVATDSDIMDINEKNHILNVGIRKESSMGLFSKIKDYAVRNKELEPYKSHDEWVKEINDNNEELVEPHYFYVLLHGIDNSTGENVERLRANESFDTKEEAVKFAEKSIESGDYTQVDIFEVPEEGDRDLLLRRYTIDHPFDPEFIDEKK